MIKGITKMIQKLRTFILAVSSALALLIPALAPAAAYAAADIQANVCEGANTLTFNNTTGTCSVVDETSTFNDILTSVVNIISVIVGVVAVVMIIVGGFRYVTSGGSAEKVGGAKNTILYGLIGLIIVALAQVIVRFVLQKTAEV